MLLLLYHFEQEAVLGDTKGLGVLTTWRRNLNFGIVHLHNNVTTRYHKLPFYTCITKLVVYLLL
jgi:hypothetical protein